MRKRGEDFSNKDNSPVMVRTKNGPLKVKPISDDAIKKAGNGH